MQAGVIYVYFNSRPREGANSKAWKFPIVVIISIPAPARGRTEYLVVSMV